jgi:hypothetical protein
VDFALASGEEMLLIELARMANSSLIHLMDVKHVHFVFVISGRTAKGNQTSGIVRSATRLDLLVLFHLVSR